MTTLMETRIYNLLIVMKMGQAFDLKVILTKEFMHYMIYSMNMILFKKINIYYIHV